MPLIRPQAAARLRRWREVLAGGAVIALGLWLARGPGPFLIGLGALVALGGIMLVLVGLRRARFRADGLAPGIVQIVEGQISYLAPEGGGFAALSEITFLSLGPGAQNWHIGTADGAVLRIPRGASGAEALFDAFAALPGMDMGVVMRALAAPSPGVERILWRADTRAGLTLAPPRST